MPQGKKKNTTAAAAPRPLDTNDPKPIRRPLGIPPCEYRSRTGETWPTHKRCKGRR